MGRHKYTNKYEPLPGYTVLQSKVIRGEIPHESVNGKCASLLLKRAQELHDQDAIPLAEKLCEECRERRRKKNNERATERSRILYRREPPQWKETQRTTYTEHNVMVIRGEIPLGSVHTNELVCICKIAQKVGDISLYERLYNIVIDRRIEALGKHNTHKRSNKDFYYRCDYLSDLYKSILLSETDSDELSIEQVRHILDVCKKDGDERFIKLATLLLNYTKHPESVYVAKDRNQAIDDIERMVGKPIRRPESWFV